VNLEDMLIRHEGLRLKPYHCTAGKLTIGIGRNIEDIGISEDEAMVLLENDIERCKNELAQFHFYGSIGEAREAALIDMLFNIGLTRFRTFEKMLHALDRYDFETAAKEMKDSRWYHQVGTRSRRLVEMMRSNEWPDK